jgi:hypothetical protein
VPLPSGVAEADVAKAHEADLATAGPGRRVQAVLGRREGREDLLPGRSARRRQRLCLVEAPDADSAHAVHRDAHGLVADEIYEVSEHT